MVGSDPYRPVELALTFDNLGEAADLERGLWPAGRPLGRHPSVTGALPQLLDELAELELRATFCVEALNCELYPEAVRGIAARGHEVAMHGWRHESWSGLHRGREAELLARGRAAFAALGIEVRGFRPPGGELTPHSAELLATHGFTWCSAAGGERRRAGPLAHVPFAWALVDAYWVLPSFAERRRALGDPPQPLAPDEAAAAICGRLAKDPAPTVILHPFLMISRDGLAAARRVLRAIAGLAAAGALGAGPVAALAAAL